MVLFNSFAMGMLLSISLAFGDSLSLDPVSVIRKKDQELQKLLRDKNVGQKTGQIKVLINGIFDFEELGRRALGKKTWPTLTPDQQTKFVTAFKNMVENSSVKKLEVYQSDSTRYDAAELDEDKANVTAHVFNKGQESIVTYKLLNKNKEWKAWDLVIDDLSTAGNYGDQFRKILQSSTINDLIAKLEKKAAGDAAKTDNVKASSEKQAQKAVQAKTSAPATQTKVAAPAASKAPKAASTSSNSTSTTPTAKP